MLPSRNQEIRQRQLQQPTAYDNNSSNINSNTNTTSSRQTNEIRTKRHQHAQGYQPYVLPGTGYKHRKHHSQPTNFLNDDHLLLNAARAVIMQSAVASNNRNNSVYPTESQEEERLSVNARLRSILQPTLENDTSQDDVSESIMNAQIESQFDGSNINTPPANNFSMYYIS